MNEKDFDVLDSSLTLRNLTPEQKKSVVRLMELAIDEARQEFQSAQQSVQRTALHVRILNAICYGWTLGTMLWLLFGSR